MTSAAIRCFLYPLTSRWTLATTCKSAIQHSTPITRRHSASRSTRFTPPHLASTRLGPVYSRRLEHRRTKPMTDEITQPHVSSNQADQITNAAFKAHTLLHDFMGPLIIFDSRFSGTTGKNLKVNGVEVTQEMLDSQPLFSENGLTVQEVIDGVNALGEFRKQILALEPALSALAKVK